MQCFVPANYGQINTKIETFGIQSAWRLHCLKHRNVFFNNKKRSIERIVDILYNTERIMSNDLQNKTAEFIQTSLDQIGVGKCCVILSCNLPSELKVRLSELGLVPHTQVTVLKTAPLGDPIEITVRGYSLCLRKETAKQFVVEVVDDK